MRKMFESGRDEPTHNSAPVTAPRITLQIAGQAEKHLHMMHAPQEKKKSKANAIVNANIQASDGQTERGETAIFQS